MYRRSPIAAGLTVLVIGAFVLAVGALTKIGTHAWEDARFSLAPSAALAFEYGSRHFNAVDEKKYDINRAQYFYTKAVVLNPDTPYLFHELARIAFLRGEFSRALNLINIQIIRHGDNAPNSYYVRGLIEGYMGQYAAASEDYAHYLTLDPHNWAAQNDYAWVLLKAGKAEGARAVAQEALRLVPDNAWLLNTYSIALHDTGETPTAYTQAVRAVVAARRVTREEWLTAYPGNDPRVADEGIATLQKATEENIHRLEVELGIAKVQ